MKIIVKLMCALMIFIFESANVKAQNLIWARSSGTSSSEIARSLSVDANGNVYYTGTFQGTMDFDPGPGTFTLSSAGSDDIYISKLDVNGNFVWARSIGGGLADAPYAIATDQSANVYITGSYNGTVDFDPGAGVSNLISVAATYDAFVLKLDVSGNFAWARSVGGNDSDHGFGLSVDASSNVFVTGYFNLTGDFDPGPGISNLTSAGTDDVFILKLNGSGSFQWARAVGGTNVDTGYSITTDAFGNVIVTGSFNQTTDFDPGIPVFNLVSAGGNDVFVLKLNSSGNFVWAKSFGGTSEDEGRSVCVDPSGNVITCGFFEVSVDFDPGPGTYSLTSNGVLDAFISKLDPSGTLIWANNTGAGGNDAAYGVTTDASGNIYSTGYFSNTVDFDPGISSYTITSAGQYDVFIDRFDASGNFIWAKCLGGTGDEVAYGIALGGTTTVHTCGNFQNTCDFDPNAGILNLISNGTEDLFVHKMCQTPLNAGSILGITSICSGSSSVYSISPVSGATSYSWNIPAGWSGSSSTFSINSTCGNSGIFTVSAVNSCGSSSAQTLSVTVKALPTLSISGSNTLCLGSSVSLTVSGASTYSWSHGATVAIVALNPTITTSYTVTGTSSVTGCSNSAITTLSIVTCTGILNLENDQNTIQIYPNPTNGELSLALPFSNGEIDIYDMNGRSVRSEKITTEKVELKLKDLPSGIYLIKIKSNSQVHTTKLIRN